MPQLEFTIWLSNALTNWAILLILVLFLNSNASTHTNSILNITGTNNTQNTNNWPWL